MTQELKDRWLAALRSDQYIQGRGRLKTSDGEKMCCLGVLCDLIDPEGWKSYGIGAYMWGDRFFVKAPDTILPLATQDLLIERNDFLGWPFEKVADWIETNIEPEDVA